MKLEIEIDCDNAAFEEPYIFNEIASVLRKIVVKLELDPNYDKWQNVLDTNGNTVGRFRLK